MTGNQAIGRYLATLDGRQRWIFLLFDQYADGATLLFAFACAALQLGIGTPSGVVLAATALVLPAACLSYGANRALRSAIGRPRRDALYSEVTQLRTGFPSFHTQFAATFGAVFTDGVARLAPPDQRWLAGATAAGSMGALVAVIAWSRVTLRAHRWIEVGVGFLLGAGIGALVTEALVSMAWARSLPVAHRGYASAATIVLFTGATGLVGGERRRRRIP